MMFQDDQQFWFETLRNLGLAPQQPPKGSARTWARTCTFIPRLLRFPEQ